MTKWTCLILNYWINYRHLLETILSKLSDIFIDLKHSQPRIYPGIAGQGLITCDIFYPS